MSLARRPLHSGIAILALGLPLIVCAQSSSTMSHAHGEHAMSMATMPSVRVVDPYVRLVPATAPASAAFFVLHNDSHDARRLVRVDSSAAKTVELHNHINDNGVMKMRPVKDIEIPAMGEATLKPGSYHVMLIDLKAPLKEGGSVPLTLVFDDGSVQKIDAPVRNITAMDMPAHGGMKP